MRVYVLTFGNSQAGSTKFRIEQYRSFLKSHDIELDCLSQNDLGFFPFHKLSESDLFFNQKCLLSRSLSRKIMAASKRVIFDFDDAIYTRPGKGYSWITQMRIFRRLHFWLKHSHRVLTANHYLAHYARRYTSRVEIIPMALDLSLWKPVFKSDDRVVIGWAGAPANLWHIQRLDGILQSLLSHHPQVRLAIYSGKRPQLSCPFDYFPFQEGTESQFIQSIDIGLLPLSEEEFSRGKSPIKAIQYLACGIPVVGNVFGATAEILNERNSLSVKSDGSWKNALETLIRDETLRKHLGHEGRKWAEAYFCRSKTEQQLLKAILC